MQSDINCTLIKKEVWDIVKMVSPAAMIVKIDIEFINAAAYLNVGQECSDNNIAIIQQYTAASNAAEPSESTSNSIRRL